MAALAARDIVAVDAGVVRLPSTSSSSTLAVAVTILGQQRPPFVTSSSSTLAASATVLAVVGRRHLALATLPSLTAARLVCHAATAAASSESGAALAYARKAALALASLLPEPS